MINTDAKSLLMLCNKVERDEFAANEGYELKLDGMRILASKSGSLVEMTSRYNHRVEKKFPEVLEELKQIPGDWTIDGELTILDGLSGTLTKLGNRNTDNKLMIDLYREELPATFYAFDILNTSGKDVRNKPLKERKKILEALIKPTKHVKFLPINKATGSIEKVLDKYVAKKYEGIVIKNLDAPYESGKRSSGCLKAKKSDTIDVEIVGVTKSDKGKPFAALVLIKDGEYYGKCGNGFGTPDIENRQKVLDQLTGTNNIPLPRPVESKLLKRCKPTPAEITIQEELNGNPRFPVLVRIRWG